MLLGGTQMHIITFICAALEVILLCFQSAYFLSRPSEKKRLWYLILLVLLINYNICSGLFPDNKIPLSIEFQNILAYGSGFIMGAYFPYYFYRAFDLKKLRFHARYGVFLFLLLPYLIFFVIEYSWDGNLQRAKRYGLIIPFFYSLTLLLAITVSIISKYRKEKGVTWEIVGVYLAVVPWGSLVIVVYFDAGQPIEASLTNFGFLIITILYIKRAIRQHRYEYLQLQKLNGQLSQKVTERVKKLDLLKRQVLTGKNITHFDYNSQYYNLTKREKEIAMLISEGYSYKKIGEILYISEKTVMKHAQNIFDKMDVSNKIELINKLRSSTL